MGGSTAWLDDEVENVSLKLIGGVDFHRQVCHEWAVNQSEGIPALCRDVTMIETWDEIGDLLPPALSMSSPCQLFSYAGAQSWLVFKTWRHTCHCNLVCEPLQLWTHIAGKCGGLKTNDPWWKFCKDVCQFAGYNVVFAETIKWVGHRPADRNRSLGILVKQPLSTLMNECKTKWIQELPQEPTLFWSSKCWFQLPNLLEHRDQLDDAVSARYADFNRLPRHIRDAAFAKSEQETLFSCPAKSNTPIPAGTAMARYDSQYSMQGAILGSLKYFKGYCFFHCIECTATMGTTQHVSFPDDPELANLIVGIR